MQGDFRNRLQKKAIRRIRLSRDDLLRGFENGIGIAPAQFQCSQGTLRIGQVRTEADSVPPL